MSWNDYLINRSRKTGIREKRIYGIEPSPVVADLLERKDGGLNLRETCRLLLYIYFKSPRRRLKLLWRYLTDRDTHVRRQQIELLAHYFRSRLSQDCRIATGYFARRNFSRDLARVPPLLETALFRTTPSLVIQPRNEKDIVKVLALAKSKGLAVFPRGSGSFAFGGSVPTRNGLVLDLSPMMSVIEVDADNQTVRIQPGARWADVAAKLEPSGLVPVTTPTSRFSTVAGWISTGGLGLDSFSHGPVGESVLRVRVARPDGSIEELVPGSESLNDLFGTEGQLGILTEITLRVRPKPEYSGPCLLTFSGADKAFEFIERLIQTDIHPSHVVFFDREFLHRENVLFSQHTGSKEPLVPEQDGILLHFETRQAEQDFQKSLNGNAAQLSENGIAARYLWSDRFFPLKAQRIGPGLLGTEVVVPGTRVPEYMAKVRKLVRKFHVDPSLEVILGRSGESYSYLVIISFSCDYSRSTHYVLSLLLIQLLVRMAVGCGGYPYGIGIWNSSFGKSRFSRAELEKLKKKKNELDPDQVLNPHKFFKIKGRLFSLFLQPPVFRSILTLAHFFAPVLGLIARLAEPKPPHHWDVPVKEDNQGKDLLKETAQRCTSCGACISVCPAYHITEDELATGRTKLRMAEAMLNGLELETAEIQASFQCLHCGLCEEVCQTQLPLRECYLVLEDWLEERFGSRERTVQRFVDQLDSRREFIREVFGLDLPEWSPESPPSRVPHVEQAAKEVEP